MNPHTRLPKLALLIGIAVFSLLFVGILARAAGNLQGLVGTPTAYVYMPAVFKEPTFTPTATPPSSGSIRFAVIGDYGTGSTEEEDVANLVKSWNPDFVITTGDNNYPDGAASTIDQNIGQYYQSYIYPYTGSYGPGATTNRFFPTLGNHDWHASNAQPYLNYFTLPGNERYYEFVWGPVHFFAIDSDSHEPDGTSSTSTQATWLHTRLAAATEPWKVVYFHHSAYSSGRHGSSSWMQWPFKAWGTTTVMAGHDHLYERLSVDGLPYFTNGAGGRGLYEFRTILPESQNRYNADHGAMQVDASASQITFRFITRAGEVIDTFALAAPASGAAKATQVVADERLVFPVQAFGIP